MVNVHGNSLMLTIKTVYESIKGMLISTFLLISLTLSAHANEKLIIASGNFAPYFIQDDVVGNGYFDQLVVKVLTMQGYPDLELIPLNNDAVARYFDNKVADIAINYTAPPPTHAFSSQYRAKFMNRVIMHPSAWTKNVTTLADLKGLKVASFIGASDIFGPDYKHMVKEGFGPYIEIGNQQAINKQLVTRKIDARVGDYLMFYWHIATNTELDPGYFVYRDILNNQGSYILFQDKSVRDRFDEGLTKMITSGEVASATQNWLEAYNLPLVDQQFFTIHPDPSQLNTAGVN